jgi:hypothetical protein
VVPFIVFKVGPPRCSFLSQEEISPEIRNLLPNETHCNKRLEIPSSLSPRIREAGY